MHNVRIFFVDFAQISPQLKNHANLPWGRCCVLDVLLPRIFLGEINGRFTTVLQNVYSKTGMIDSKSQNTR